jgi:glycosyltransferase involved in cell wall biosynthesis
MTPTVLWAVPRWPLPVDDGGRVNYFTQIRALVSTKAVVDLLALADDGVCDVAEAQTLLGVRNVHIVRTRMRARGEPGLAAARAVAALLAHPRMATTVARFAAADVRHRVRSLVEHPREHWDALVFDGAHVAAAFSSGVSFQRPRRPRALLYRSHNVEADLWAQMARRAGLPMRLFLGYQQWRLAAFERSVVRSASAVATVSPADTAAFRRMCPLARVETIPFAFSFPPSAPPPPPVNLPLELLFLGRMDWPPNRQGLVWLLDQVWPEVARRRPDLRLAIAGSGDVGWVRARTLPPQVRHLGFVRELEPLYARIAVSVVPLFFGSGASVKVVEAAAKGRGSVATGLGVRGTNMEPGQAYLRAETRQQWIETLSTLDHARCAALGRAAFTQARRRFDSQLQASRLRALIDEITAPGFSCSASKASLRT